MLTQKQRPSKTRYGALACQRCRARAESWHHAPHCPLMVLQVMEIKRLNGAIAAVKSELNKQQERLEECKRWANVLEPSAATVNLKVFFLCLFNWKNTVKSVL